MNDEFKQKFLIESIPTFIFYYKQKPIAWFKDANQPAPKIRENEEDPDYVQKLKDVTDPKEHQLRKYFEKLCACSDITSHKET